MKESKAHERLKKIVMEFKNLNEEQAKEWIEKFEKLLKETKI